MAKHKRLNDTKALTRERPNMNSTLGILLVGRETLAEKHEPDTNAGSESLRDACEYLKRS